MIIVQIKVAESWVDSESRSGRIWSDPSEIYPLSFSRNLQA